jgi:hypothetical protein
MTQASAERKMKDLLHHYHNTGALLDAQRQALEDGKDEGLDQLLKELETQSRLLEAQSSLLGSLDGKSREQVRTAIKDLFEKLEVVQTCWSKRRRELEQLQSQLCSARRLTRGLRSGETPRARLLDMAG